MNLLQARIESGAESDYTLETGRGAWIQAVTAAFSVNGHTLQPGDGLAIEDEAHLRFQGQTSGEFLLFDLA